MNAGRRTCAVSGVAVMAGPCWPSSSTAVAGSCWASTLSRSGKARTAEAALEQALIARFGTLGRVPCLFLLRSDNGLVFTSRSYTALVRSYGLRQEFITPHSPEQNGMIERVIRTLKDQCEHRHRFETVRHASRVISDWDQLLKRQTASVAGDENGG